MKVSKSWQNFHRDDSPGQESWQDSRCSQDLWTLVQSHKTGSREVRIEKR